MWRARRTGLTDDDLREMAPDELDAWFELDDWLNAGDEDEEEAQKPTQSERSFFHM